MSSRETPQIAVWYFVAATFVFASTTLFFDSPVLWVRIVSLVVGFVLIAAGGFQLSREMKARKRDAD